MNYLAMLVRYKAWADTLLISAASQLSEQQLMAARPIVFGSILRTLHHVYAMDLVWQATLLAKPHGTTTRNPQDCPTLVELQIAQASMDEWYTDYVDSLTDAARSEQVKFTFIGGRSGVMTREAIVLHVVNHTTYHRGHIGDMFYACAVEPPTTDLSVFLTQRLEKT